jgi:hypothetical protein
MSDSTRPRRLLIASEHPLARLVRSTYRDVGRLSVPAALARWPGPSQGAPDPGGPDADDRP